MPRFSVLRHVTEWTVREYKNGRFLDENSAIEFAMFAMYYIRDNPETEKSYPEMLQLKEAF